MLLSSWNIVLGTALAACLIALIVRAPLAPDPSVPATAAGAVSPAATTRQALLETLLTMIVAGAAGGVLCNLRGLFRWMAENDGRFPIRYEIPFVVRPFTGALTGLFMFFVGNLLVGALAHQTSLSWLYLEGRLPYVGFALVSGFASQEFMQRLKEVAKTAFGSADTEELRPAANEGEPHDRVSS